MPGIEDYLNTGKSQSVFLEDLLVKIGKDRGWDHLFISMYSRILIGIIISIVTTLR